MPAPFDEEAWLASLWREVQANQVFGVQACLVGECYGQIYAGRSAILAPVEMTEGGRGLLAQSPTTEGEQVVAAELDLDALQKVVDGYPHLSLLSTMVCMPASFRVADRGGNCNRLSAHGEPA